MSRKELQGLPGVLLFKRTAGVKTVLAQEGNTGMRTNKMESM